MKARINNYLQEQLKNLSIKFLNKYHPEIIAITGSNGKSSTKEAVATVLKAKFNVLSSPGNYNTEFGVPLSILEERMPCFIIKWPYILLKSYLKLFFKNQYYQKLVLEIAADKPGDIEYLTSFIKPDVGILTSIGESHLELFKNIDNVAKEKSILLKRTKTDGFLCLNYDDPRILKIGKKLSHKIIWYGCSDKADLWGSNFEQNLNGIKFNINYKNDSLPIIIYNVLGKHFIYPILAGASVGIIYGMSLGKVINQLKKVNFPKGRMRIINGINESKIIDDSYNANPNSMIAALETVNLLKKDYVNQSRIIGVLGTMNELGDYEQEGHEKVGRKAAEVLDFLITIGKPANSYLTQAAIKKGFLPNRIFKFNNSIEAGQFLKKFIKNYDIILVKGSQNNVRTEWVVEQIMENPEKAKELLVRQERPWKKPKF